MQMLLMSGWHLAPWKVVFLPLSHPWHRRQSFLWVDCSTSYIRLQVSSLPLTRLSSQLRFSLRGSLTDWLSPLKWYKCCHYANFSLSLCFEDINLQDNEELKFILKIVNLVFAVLFTVEMILKWFAFGLNKYFSSVWTCLDFVIVLVRRHLCSHCTPVMTNGDLVISFRFPS